MLISDESVESWLSERDQDFFFFYQNLLSKRKQSGPRQQLMFDERNQDGEKSFIHMQTHREEEDQGKYMSH